MKKNIFSSEKEKFEVMSLASKILKILYYVMMAGIIFIVIKICKELNVFVFIFKLLNVISPFFVGFIIAWLFNPLVIYLNKKGLSRILSSTIVYLFFLLIVYLFIRTLIPTVFDQMNDLIKLIPSVYSELKDFVVNILDKFRNIEGFDIVNVQTSLLTSLEKIASSITTNLPNTLINIISSLFSSLGTFLLCLVIGFYMLFNFDNTNEHFMSLIPKKYRYEIEPLVAEISYQLRKYVNGTLLCALLVCVLSTIVFMIFGLKAPLLFGIFCGITNIIPYIGPYIGAAPAVLVAFSQGGPTGIIVLIMLLIIQTLEGNLLNPLIMSKTMKLHPVTIMASLVVFGYFFGMWGMILATPLVAFFKIIINYLIIKFDLFDYDSEPTELIDLEPIKNSKKGLK